MRRRGKVVRGSVLRSMRRVREVEGEVEKMPVWLFGVVVMGVSFVEGVEKVEGAFALLRIVRRGSM